MTPSELTSCLKAEALRVGFCLAGACVAAAPPGYDRFGQWLADGYAGDMHYLGDRREAYSHPRHVLESVQSLLVLAADYRTVAPTETSPTEGRISRYAWSLDYHDTLRSRLHDLADLHRELTPGVSVRGVVDTAPLLEREFAVLAGLGWIGKNTLLLTRERGSWLFLAALLTSAELEPDRPTATGHCGTCRACLDACPTGALVAPYVLDARRCISYLTIEKRGPIEPDLRTATGQWLFGCDICQDVCPWNVRLDRRTPDDWRPEREFEPLEGATSVELTELFSWDDDAFRKRFRKTPLWRAKRRGLLRNAAMVLGNQCAVEAVSALIGGLADDEPLVRVASAWALGRIGTDRAVRALGDRLACEADSEVADEIRHALG